MTHDATATAKYIASLREKRRAALAEKKQIDWSPFHKWMSIAECKKLEAKLGITYRRGKFSKSEDKCIRDFITNYFKDKPEEYQKFIQNLAVRTGKMQEIGPIYSEATKALNNGRTVLSVHFRIRRLYHPHISKYQRWTPEEDEELKRLIAIHGPKWETIARELQKEAFNCRDHYKRIREIQFNFGPWSEDETQRLREAMADIERSGRNSITGSFWAAVAQKVGTRSFMQCHEKWSVLVYKLKSPLEFFWSKFEDFRLVSAIYDLCPADESEIVWSKITDPETSHRPPSSCRSRWYILKKRVSRAISIQDDLDLILEELLRQLHPSAQEWLQATEPLLPTSSAMS